MRGRLIAVIVLACSLANCGESTDSTVSETTVQAPTSSEVTSPVGVPGDVDMRPELRRGDDGPWVVELQRALTSHGFTLEADGDFGPVTEAAVRDFQESLGLTVDGVVRHDTWTALETTAVPTSESPSLTVSTGTAAESPVPVAEGWFALGPPNPALFPASPSEEIDWVNVGPGWLVVDHPTGYGGPFVEPTTLDARGLYLVSPDDAIYAVSALPSDGSRVVAVSDDGRQVLLEEYDPACAEGCTCPDDATGTMQVHGYAVVDSTTAAMRSLIDPVSVSVCEPGRFVREIDFTADGRGVWISETWFGDDQRHATRVRLGRVDTGTGAWTTIIDEPVVVDSTAPPSSSWVSLVELDDGRIVTTTRAETWLRGAGGAPIRQLDAPNSNCALESVWGADHVLARCRVTPDTWPSWPSPMPMSECPATGLWLIAVDGSTTESLAVPVNDTGELRCWIGYTRAERIDEVFAIQVGSDGSCPSWVVFSDHGSITHWEPEISNPCAEILIGVRREAWVIEARPETDPAVIFNVTGDTSTVLGLPSGEVIAI